MATFLRALNPRVQCAASRQPPASAVPSCSYAAATASGRHDSGAQTATFSVSSSRQFAHSCRRPVIARAEFEDVESEDDPPMALPKDEEDWEAEYEQLKAAGPPPGMPPEQFEANLAAYRQAMSDPAARERMMEMQRLAAQPEMQQQMAQMASVMQNKQLMERMAELKNDPDMKEFFEAVEAGGPAAVSQYMSNANFLAKLGEKLGDIDMGVPGDAYAGASAANAAPPGAQAPPEIENLLQAAKYGDLEATEDLIAVGHDVNMTDAEKRTPLHYAVAYRQLAVMDELLRSSANLEATDSKGNTPLHYAAGYGRGEFVKGLIEAGANGKALNDSEHTPYQLVTMEERNPINQETEVLQLLEKSRG